MTNYITTVGVQQFSITIASGSASGTATINAVGSGAFILFDGINPSTANNPALDFSSVTLTNSTTVTASRNTGTSGTVVITGCIVDGDTTNLIASVQYGSATIALNTGSGNATISAVTNANTAIHLLGWKSTATTYSGSVENPSLSLSGTTVTASRGNTTGAAITVGFAVIEFRSGALNQSVQNVAATSSASVSSYTATISATSFANTLCIYSGSQIATSTTNIGQAKQRGALTSTTLITVNVNTAVANAKAYKCCVVEFASGVLNSTIQRGTTTLTGVASNTSPLTSVNQAYSALNWLGNTDSATTAVINQAEGQVALGVSGVTFVQETEGQGSTTTISVLPAATVAGNTIIVGINLRATSTATTVNSVTDNKSQTWTQVPGARATDSTTNAVSDIWYVAGTLAGVTSITVTLSAASASTSFVDFSEWSGINTSSPVGTQAAKSNGASSTSQVSTALTTSSAGLIYVVDAYPSSTTVTGILAPYTILDAASNTSAFSIKVAAVTAETCTFTTLIARTYCASSAFFNIAASPPQVVTVTKNSATSNLIGSWEVLEFVPPAPTGNAAGTSTVVGVGASTFAAVGSASGIATVLGTSLSSGNSIGASSGTATVLGVGTAIKNSIGSSSGTSTATAVGSSTAASVGASSGIATVTGVGQAQYISVGNAAGTSTVVAAGAAATSAVGSSSGTSTATAVGASRFNAVGSSNGVATVAGIGSSIFNAIANAVGTSTVLGTSQSLFRSVANATGSATAVGVGIANFFGVGSSSGNATVTGVGLAAKFIVGNAAGIATVIGHGIANAFSIGNAAGSANVQGVGTSVVRAVGNAAGVATVIGHAPFPVAHLPLWGFLSEMPVNITGLITPPEIAELQQMTNELASHAFMSKMNVNCVGSMNNSPIALKGNF